jgi:prepilin signal peptidase PulO-like enzyme (type II secretory pathway)
MSVDYVVMVMSISRDPPKVNGNRAVLVGSPMALWSTGAYFGTRAPTPDPRALLLGAVTTLAMIYDMSDRVIPDRLTLTGTILALLFTMVLAPGNLRYCDRR